MKFFLLSLIGALIYHAIQVRQFMSSAWGLFIPARTSFLDMFLKTIVDPIDIPALQTLSGPMNLLIGGSIGFAVALVVHFLQPRGASGQQPRAQLVEPGRSEHPEGPSSLGEADDAEEGDTDAEEVADSAHEPERPAAQNAVETKAGGPKPAQVVMVALLLGGLGYLGFLMLGAQQVANGAAAPHDSSAKPLPISISDLRGEWYNDFSGGRNLRLRGALFNFEGNEESFERLDCALVLRVHFDSAREPTEIRGSTCAFVNAMPRGEYKTFEDGWGTTVERKWLDYGVSRVEMRIVMTARNPFGEQFSTEISWTDIPLPSTRSRFEIATAGL
ncbi:MAG: hypothetical protein IPK13_20195 [Deltaproteobacteria bacterium]|nr:hypothetical protein [Deltaproteobacteria bacterium]